VPKTMLPPVLSNPAVNCHILNRADLASRVCAAAVTYVRIPGSSTSGLGETRELLGKARSRLSTLGS